MILTYYSYDQICLVPNLSKLKSRSEADVSLYFGSKRFKLPVMPANMACTIDYDKAKWLSQNDYFYVMHRFCDVKEFVSRSVRENLKNISISIGVKKADFELVSYFAKLSKDSLRTIPDYITIDVAHGHSVLVKNIIEHIKNEYSESKMNPPFIIAGNVATRDGVVALAGWGADAAKVGIAQGGACTTYGKTGFGMPMFTCVQECAQGEVENPFAPEPQKDEEPISIPIIADGGIRTNGDIAKALVAGAKMVMIGSLFAACDDSPAPMTLNKEANDLIDNGYTFKELIDNKIPYQAYKIFYGSASINNGNKKHIEGTQILLPVSGMRYEDKLTEIKEDLQSSVSYAGGNDLSIFKTVNWVDKK